MAQYDPFGNEWEKELNKLPKQAIIQMYKTVCIENNKLKSKLMPKL